MIYIIGSVTGLMCVLLITIKFLCELSSRVLTFWHHEGRERGTERTIYNYVRGKYLEPRSCYVSWDWKEPCEVGQSMGFRVHLFYRNGHPYPVGSTASLRVRITHTELALEVPVTLEVVQDPGRNVVKGAFTVRKSGRYQITISIGRLSVGHSPYYKVFQPGAVVPLKTQIVSHFSTLVLTCGEQHTLQIAPCDQYSNPSGDKLRDNENYTLTLSELGVVGIADGCCQFTVCNGSQHRVLLHLMLLQTGCFQATLRYQAQPISNGNFNIIVLTEGEKDAVDNNVSRSGVGVFFEGYLYPPSTSSVPGQRSSSPIPSDECELSPIGLSFEKAKKPKKVYFYISPKQLSVKEFYLRIIPWRLYTFRVCPGTKFLYLPPDPLHGLLSLQVDDGLQPPIEISCKERNVMAATFTRFLHLNIGGSETFQDKVLFFQKELRLLHCRKTRCKITLRVSRHSLLESVSMSRPPPILTLTATPAVTHAAPSLSQSVRATRNFSASDWTKNFEVVFQDEEALDWGGPRREWFELICKCLFDTSGQLFTRFSDTNQGLYFETDDPDFFQSKVLYLLSNDVSDTDLVFAEEKYGRGGQLEKVIELIPGGSQASVTNDNKLYYLNLLAQHRLCNQVRDEVEHFLKGDALVLGSGVQPDAGGTGSAAAVYHRIVTAAPGGLRCPLPQLPNYWFTSTWDSAHRTHLVSKYLCNSQLGVPYKPLEYTPLQPCRAPYKPLEYTPLQPCRAPYKPLEYTPLQPGRAPYEPLEYTPLQPCRAPYKPLEYTPLQPCRAPYKPLEYTPLQPCRAPYKPLEYTPLQPWRAPYKPLEYTPL
uniref:HECT-type E3 ubiquitin transferase n=1 Tax=Leptobrachium leishanense TaxID=445787 RepID=A0A8C5QM95_9ANUR